MIDVHPPHHTANSWRDFLIHIATIVVGLLIAIGLEQCVELLHQHHEVRETREALRLEGEANRNRIILETNFWRRGTAALENNLLVLRYLQQHPGTPQDKLPGVLHWGTANMVFAHAVWDSAQQTGVIKLLPREEATNDAFLYMEFDRIEEASTAVHVAVDEAEEFDLVDPDPTHLSPAQLAEVISLTERALTKQILHGEALANLNSNFPDLPPTITHAEIDKLRGKIGKKTPDTLSAAEAITNARLDAGAPAQDFTNSPVHKK